MRVAVESLLARPESSAPVTNQACLGATLEVLETTPASTEGFARIRTSEGYEGWIPTVALASWPDGAPAYGDPARGPAVEVTSVLAHLYREPSFTGGKPLLTAGMGTRLERRGRVEPPGSPPFVEVELPGGGRAFLAEGDLAPCDPAAAPVPEPARWLALGERLLGAPYTWGGTTARGFDCSGFTQFVLGRHGILVKRDAYQQCFQEPRLVAVAPERPEPGDLLFFGSESNISHVAMYAGGGEVLEATRAGRPCLKRSPLESPRLKPDLRYARRLRELAPPEAPRATLSLEAALLPLVLDGKPKTAVAFGEIGGPRLVLGGEHRVHAASTFKTAVLLEILRRVDAGTLSWDRPVEVRNEFASVAGGTPYRLELEPEQEANVIPSLGGTAPLGGLAREMVARSSNLATNLCLGVVGADAVQRLCDAIGAGGLHVRRGVEDEKAYEKGIVNETDVASLARVMEACAVDVPGLALSARSRALLWEILASQHYNEEIPAGLHPQAGAVVAHKTGRTSSVRHDAAVVRLPDGRLYVLVALTWDLAGEEDQRRAVERIRRVSRLAWEFMVSPVP